MQLFRRIFDEEKITFTRSRTYKKNDNCYIEQKNYSVIRRLVGYNAMKDFTILSFLTNPTR
jgi:hypothetical protein